MAYGTLSVSDTLASTIQSVAEFGEDRAFAAISEQLDAHNAIVREDLEPMVEFTTDRQRIYGGNDSVEMVDADEFSTADAQKVAAGQTLGFPLRLSQFALQWTRKWMQNHTPAELQAQYDAARTADIRKTRKSLLQALTNPTNVTFVDRLVDGVSLSVKRLLNADSVSIPPDPYGTTFDGTTHTHYLGTGSFVVGDLTGAIDTVVEHNPDGAKPMVYINKAQEAAVRAFTGFVAYLDARIIPAPGGTTQFAQGNLEVTNTSNRAIGIIGAAEVWVKSWVPANYIIVWDMSMKPLVARVRPGVGMGFGDLQLAADDEAYPLRAQHFEREIGFGVWQRAAAAVLRTNNATYAAPTIT